MIPTGKYKKEHQIRKQKEHLGTKRVIYTKYIKTGCFVYDDATCHVISCHLISFLSFH